MKDKISNMKERIQNCNHKCMFAIGVITGISATVVVVKYLRDTDPNTYLALNPGQVDGLQNHMAAYLIQNSTGEYLVKNPEWLNRYKDRAL